MKTTGKPEEIERMQKNLLLIRNTAGWSAAEFGDRIGVTRQTINNLEAGKAKLSKTQYIAMRAVLDAAISEHPKELEMLKLILNVYVDGNANISSENKEKLKEYAGVMASATASKNVSRAEVSDRFIEMATLMLGTRAVNQLISVAIGGWLLALMQEDNKLFGSKKKR